MNLQKTTLLHWLELPNSLHLFTLSLLLLASPLAARPAKDIIHFKNKDTWTCEIKKLEQGYLYVGLDYVDGTVQVNWSEVESIESSQLFVLIDTRGKLYAGSLSASTGGEAIATVAVGSGESAVRIPKSQVTSIQQTEFSFWHDFHGAVNLGFNFAKSSNQTQYNLGANLDYLKQYWEVSTQLQSSFSGAVKAPSDLHNDLSTYALRMLGKKNYFLAGVSDFLQSDEQQLALRTTFGGGAGKILRSTERSRILLMGGAVWARERYTTSDTPQMNNAEGMIGAALEYFKFKTTNCSMTLFVYPSMTEPGRVRADGKAGVKYELIKNLYVNLSLYMNYDSRPQLPTSKSDYGASSGLGWSF